MATYGITEPQWVQMTFTLMSRIWHQNHNKSASCNLLTTFGERNCNKPATLSDAYGSFVSHSQLANFVIGTTPMPSQNKNVNVAIRCLTFTGAMIWILWWSNDSSSHYSGVIMNAMVSQITSVFAQTFVQAQIKENIKAQRHWTLWGKSNGDRWIPLTKGQ